jgi:hypothetical protein
MAALVVRAGPRLRFSVLWIFVTLAPASLFTWGIESRYLYLPAAGFALVLADLMLGLYTSSMGSFSPRVARIVTIFVVAGVSVRFAVFAEKSARDFRQQTLAVAVREANPAPGPGGVVVVDRSTAETVPPMYLEPALQTIYCRSDVRAIVR